MKHILIFILLCFSGSLFAQYPAGANKLVLGRQTTGDGLIFRGTGSPAFTPTSNANAWFFLDTSAQVLYTHIGGTWVSLADTITSGGTVTLSGEVVGASNATKLDTVDRVIFDPTNGGADSTYKLTYNANDFTLHFGMGIGSQIYQMGQELYYPPCINKTASTIYAGQPVMIDTSGIIQGDRLAVMPAFADGLPANYIVGVAAHDIAPNAEGLVTWFGYVPEVDHADVAASGFTLDVGDILYLSATPGKYRDTEPTPPAVNSTIAIVVRKPNANNMTLLVRPWLNEKLGDLRDVDLAGLQTGDGIKWNGTKWVAGTFAGADSTVVSAGYGIDVSEVSNNFTVSADTSELSTKWFAADTASGVRDWVVNENYLRHNLADLYRLLYSTDSGGDTIASVTSLVYNHYPVKLGVGVNPTAALDISGDIRISDLSTHTPTRIVGADADGDLGDLIIGNGLTVSGDSLIASGGSGTVTSIATNNGITGGTITTTGTIGLTGQALALHNLSTNGLIARTGAGTVAGRTITAGTGISVTNGDGVSGNPTITNSAPDQTVVVTAGTGISTSGTYPNFTITNSAPDQTVSITGAGINAVTGTYPNFTITGTEVDGSTTNELQTLSASSNQITLSNSGGSVTIAGAGINTVGTVGSTITVTGTEVDGSTTNEGTLGVGAGGANTAVITSNTSGANGVTISGGSNIAITETTSSNGGTVTIAATGIPTKLPIQFRGASNSQSGSTPINYSYDLTDTLNFGYLPGSGLFLDNDSTANKINVIYEIDHSVISTVSRLADSTSALRAAFPTTIYTGNGTLSAARTISTAGHKLTISGSNTAQVLEIDNTNTGTTTNALTLQSFGPPLQATRLTSSTGSILPVSDYFVNTSSTAAVGLGGFQRFYIEDAGGLNKEAGRIGFRTSDATGNSYDSEAFISVRKDSSELKEGLTLLSTGQLQLKEYGDTLFTGTAVKYLAVADDGKVIEVDGAAGTVKGTGAANKVAIWASSDSLYQNTNLHWDNTNGRLGINNTSPSERLHVGGIARATTLQSNSFSTQILSIGNPAPTGSLGDNVVISNHQLPSATYSSAADGYGNVSVGSFALIGLTTGFQNFAFGRSSMFSNTTGYNNTAIGVNSAYSNTAGNDNLAIGTQALYANTTGALNIAIGSDAVKSAVSSNFIVGIGSLSLANITGANNTAIGSFSGTYINSGSNNVTSANSIYIGYGTRASANGNTNEVVIGYEGRGNGSNTTTLGNTSTTGTFLAAGNLNLTGQAATLVQTARHTTSNTAGNSLTLKVGGATSGATDKAGGDLILESGVSTGNASSNIIFETAAAGSSGTTDRSPAEVARINGAGKLGLGTTSPNGRLEIVEINPLTTTQLEVLTITSNTSTTPSSGLGSKIIFRGETTTTESSPQSEIVSLWQTATHASRRSRIAFRTIENGGEMSNRVVINGDKVGVGLNHNSPTNTLDVNGSFGRGAPVTVTDSLYGVPLTTNWIIANRSGQIQLVLPTASDFTGRELMVKTITANTVISGNSNVVPLIGGTAGTAILPATDGAWATLVSDGTNWIIMQSGQ